jgi:hypothetical protein
MSILHSQFLEKADTERSVLENLLIQSINELRLSTAAHSSAWHLDKAAWNLDQDTGLIVFTTPDGLRATCSAQVVGTYNTDDHSWLWAWDHPSIDPALREHAMQVLAYGEEHGVEALTTRKFECEESDAWEFAALTCKLCQAQGAYRGSAGNVLVFLTFSDIRLSKNT